MPIVKPSKQRHSCRDTGESLVISIPSQRNWFMLFIFGFWLIVWAVLVISLGLSIVVNVIVMISNDPGTWHDAIDYIFTTPIFAVFFLVGYAALITAGAFALRSFLWYLIGKDVIEVSADSIKLKRAIFRFGRINEFIATDIKDLRISPLSMDNGIFNMFGVTNFWKISTGGLLAFDYGSKTIRFGGGIEEAESKQVLSEITTRFPQYLGR
jgi:hypothetical protein